MGTRLVASVEAYAHPEYQRRLVAATGPAVTTTAFGPEWPGERYRLLPTPRVVECVGREHEMPDPATRAGGDRPYPTVPALGEHALRHAAVLGDPAHPGHRPATGTRWRIPAGNGVGAVHDVRPAAEIVTELMADAHALLARPAVAGG